jgi:hypothetical protein
VQIRNASAVAVAHVHQPEFKSESNIGDANRLTSSESLSSGQ